MEFQLSAKSARLTIVIALYLQLHSAAFSSAERTGKKLLQTTNPSSQLAPSQIQLLQQQQSSAYNPLARAPAASPAIAKAPNAATLDYNTYDLPLALFPLRTPGLQSFLGAYKGASSSASFPYDPVMNMTTLSCGQGPSGNFSRVTFPDIPFADDPNWAVIFWMKANESKEDPQPIFAYSAQETQNDDASIWAPSQIKMVLMGSDTGTVFGGNNQPGVLRTNVRDQNTNYTGPNSITYLDSNGRTSNTSNTTAGGRVDDNQWHMITVTSLIDGPGFQMFVDGAYAGRLRTNVTTDIEFGAPLNIESNIYLCTDPNIDPTSGGGYTGRLSELSLWNVSFDAGGVRDFYLEHWDTDDDEDDLLSPAPTLSKARGPAAMQSSSNPQDVFDAMLLRDLSSLPDAVAYFPLDQDLSSEIGEASYNGRAVNVTWSAIDKMGSSNNTALTCSKKDHSHVSLDAVKYGEGGEWAINLWFRPAPSGLVGDAFEYIFSQQNSEQNYYTGWEANQVRLYFPQGEHPAFGVIRAIVKDSTASGSTLYNQTFLDSDSRIGTVRRLDSTNPALRAGSLLLQDGQWHMLTVTTLVGQRGFAMFVDGDIAGVLNTTTVQAANFSSVDGGQPMNLTGNISLCARNSSGYGAYDGQLSQLLVFNGSLTRRHVAGLYLAAVDDYDQTDLSPVAAPAPAPSLTGLRDRYNDLCQSPVFYNNATFNGCATFDVLPNTPLCWVQDEQNDARGQWSQCAANSPVSVRNISTLGGFYGREVRATASQRECILPTVLNGALLTDCPFDDEVVTRGCQMPSGAWDKCASQIPVRELASPLLVPFIGQPAGFLVTNRTTVTGEACALPIVANGSLWTNCAPQGLGNSATICLTESRQWQQCKPLNTSAVAANSTYSLRSMLLNIGRLPLNGGAGGLCIPEGFRNLSGVGKSSACQSGLTCIPFPIDQAAPQVAYAISFGYCVQLAKGAKALAKAYTTINNASLPSPDDFFPLTGTTDSDLKSVTVPSLGGRSFGVSWTSDDMFESALTCSRQAQSNVQLQSSGFSFYGQWAINLWFKKLPGMSDTVNVTAALGYIFSNAAPATNGYDPTQANQVHIYLPSATSKSFGIVRSIVKDDLDKPDPKNPTEGQVFLDSDGLVNNVLDGPRNQTDVNDGSWHMVTLSTNYAQYAGYRMFIDGQPVAQLSGNSTAITLPSNSTNTTGFRVGGGAPIDLSGFINLCGRADGAKDRVFDGKIAHLALFSRFLTANQIQNLYRAYIAPAALLSPAPGPGDAVVSFAPVPGALRMSAPYHLAPAPGPFRSSPVGASTTQSGSQNQPEHKGNNHTGAIVGGVVGGVVGALALAGLAYWFTRGRGIASRPSSLSLPKKSTGSSLEMNGSQNYTPYVRHVDDVGFGGRPDQASAPVNR